MEAEDGEEGGSHPHAAQGENTTLLFDVVMPKKNGLEAYEKR